MINQQRQQIGVDEINALLCAFVGQRISTINVYTIM